MSWRRTVGELYRALASPDLRRYEVLASPDACTLSAFGAPTSAQTGCQFATQRASTLDEQGLVDGLMADAHGDVIQEVNRQASSDLLGSGARPPAILPRADCLQAVEDAGLLARGLEVIGEGPNKQASSDSVLAPPVARHGPSRRSSPALVDSPSPWR